jgi:AcrR family transcriptional regulator
MQQPAQMRKKPRQARSDATVEAIVEAAALILENDGEAGLTTARIAERAGVSIGSVYQYFPNKDAIVLTLFRQEREAVAATITQTLADFEALPSEAVVEATIAAFVAYARANRKRRRLIALALALSIGHDDRGFELHNQIGALVARFSQYDPNVRPLSPAAAFVITRAVIGTIRLAIFENADVLDDPEFEAELCRLVNGFIRT